MSGGTGIDPAVLAAVVAAVEATWPVAAGGDGRQAPPEPARWRFSSRWWTAPVAVRRPRPW